MIGGNIPTELEPVEAHNPIQLDWVTYFHNFVAEHGEPIEVSGKLLFPDGWTYSSTDHQGPEWPPPTDPTQLRDLQWSYWFARSIKLQEEYRVYDNWCSMLVQWQSAKSMPLQQRVEYQDRTEEGWEVTRLGKPEDLDLSVLRAKRTDLKLLLDQAQTKLEELNHAAI